ncbi:hypothetical protein RAS1_20400 [Phycisphaerae bacterium RAS1]|nr:hypothetical protein RAS1_20400 [Phycisphaerae bacterium RAS1]
MSTHCKSAFARMCALLCASLLVSVANGATSYTFTANGASSGHWNSPENW